MGGFLIRGGVKYDWQQYNSVEGGYMEKFNAVIWGRGYQKFKFLGGEGDEIFFRTETLLTLIKWNNLIKINMID